MKIVIGSTAVAAQAVRQYKQLGFLVEVYDSVPSNIDGCDEIFVAMAKEDEDSFRSDSKAVALILPLLAKYSPQDNGGKKLLCQILLYSQNTLHAFRTNNLASELSDRIEMWPFTMEEIGAQQILFDRTPIAFESESTVHVVIFGMTRWAEAVANAATLLCHYPNYSRDQRLRTRITIIDEDIDVRAKNYLTRYSNLFDNSYIRFVDISQKRSHVSRPKYSIYRSDFVDIEWEFVKADVHDSTISTKMSQWYSDSSRQLTIALCYEDDETNLILSEMFSRQAEGSNVAIYSAVSDDAVFHTLTLPENIHPLGGCNTLDVSLPVRRMAQIVNLVYTDCYNSSSDEVKTPSEIDTTAAAELWNKENDAVLRWSSVCNAISIKTKMHSLGHDPSDWSTFYSVTSQEIESLAVVEHNRWSVEKLMAGFRPLTDEEIELLHTDPGMKKVFKAAKAHSDLRSYYELERDDTGKDVRIYDICLSAAIPLMANALMTKEETK